MVSYNASCTHDTRSPAFKLGKHVISCLVVGCRNTYDCGSDTDSEDAADDADVDGMRIDNDTGNGGGGGGEVSNMCCGSLGCSRVQKMQNPSVP